MYRFNEAPPSATSPSGTTMPLPQNLPASRPGSGHDAGSGPGPSTSANRSRRATTSHPPPSSEDQAKRANRMTAMHPLSLSVPSIPKQLPPQIPGEPAQADRSKSVAFSDPEDNEPEEQSDNSSICQSPSWEGWNKKKKKQPKTPSVKEKKEKKRGNRLSKHPKTISPTEKVLSAPQPDSSALPKSSSDTQLHPANYPPPPPIPEDTDTMFSRSKRRQSQAAVEDKPKSRRFLSGFRFQSPNMTAVQKIMQEGGHAEAPQMRKSLSAGPPTASAPQEPLFMNPVNATPRSHSSIDSRPPLTSLPSSSSTATSNHGRSHSLLSSTFGRLRSPSQGHHAPGNLVDPADRPVSHMVEYSKHVYPEHVVQTPGSIRDSVLVSSSELTEAGPLSPPNFHHPPLALRVPQASNRVSASMQNQVGAQGKSGTSQYEAYRLPGSEDAQQPSFMRREENRRYTQKSITAAGLMQRPLNPSDQQDASLTSSSSLEEEYSSAPENPVEQGFPARAQGPPSVIRPFRPQGKPAAEIDGGSKPRSSAPNTNSIGCAVSADVLDQMNAAKNAAGNAPQDSKRENDDYFGFMSEAYAPPSLELRSPLDNMLHTLRVAELPDNSRDNEPKKDAAAEDRPASHDGPTLARLDGTSSGSTGRAPGYGSSHPAKGAEGHQNNSGGSSSSAGSYDDSPPSPSTATTVDNSRPQSRKGATLQSNGNGAELPSQPYRTAAASSRSHAKSGSASSSGNEHDRVAAAQQADDDWSRTAMPLDFEDSAKGDGTDTPSQISTPGSSTDVVDELKETDPRKSRKATRQTMPPRSASASDLPSTYFLPPLKHQSFNPKKGKARMSSPGLPTPPAEPADDSRPSSSHKARSHSGSSQEGALVSASAYLQEARRAVSTAPTLNSRMSRVSNGHRSSASASKIPPVPEPHGEPVAKVLVECCNCKFLHDMPSRVYEAMAKPDSMVEDKLLGVSAAISTTVKCPWCTHGMSTQCCSGYAAMIFLKEKLHGK